MASPQEGKKGGSLSGFRGKAIWDALENPAKHPGVIEQLSSRYTFVLARHIEQVIDQGQLDRQRNRESVPESSAPIGGLRGEVQSWLPQFLCAAFLSGWRPVVDRLRGRAGRTPLGRFEAWWTKFCTSST